MPKMITCTLNGQTIDVNVAIGMRDPDSGEYPDFRCNECNQSVQPKRAGGHVAAHFAHLEREYGCSLSDVAR